METKTMTKADLVEMLFNRMGMNKRDAKDMVDAFFDEIRAALESGRTVKLSGFGNFQLRDKAQRRDYGAPRGDLSCQSEIERSGRQDPPLFARNH